jgi:uncharacterized protein (DUF2147 family)
MKSGFIVAISLALLTMGSVRAEPLPTVAGFWESEDDQGKPQAWFFFEEKEGSWLGHLVKGFKKPGEKFVDTCVKCTGERKNARMLGLAIVTGMKRDGLTYKEGSILDPRDGSVYHAEMELSADGKELGVRGYIGMPIFGQTQTWKRLPDDAIPPSDMPKQLLAGSPAPKKQPKGEAHKPAIAPTPTPASDDTQTEGPK